ncbi:unnamed protein product, partial [Brenthis ino]
MDSKTRLQVASRRREAVPDVERHTYMRDDDEESKNFGADDDDECDVHFVPDFDDNGLTLALTAKRFSCLGRCFTPLS